MTTHTGYTISAAARLLNVPRMTIYRWIESGRLQPVRTSTRQIIPHQQVVDLRLNIRIVSHL